MNKQEIETKVIEVIKEQISDELSVSTSSSLREDLELDSLDILEISMTCEKDLGVTINDDEYDGISTVKDLVDIIDRKLNG